ncbi:hypothetical protein HanHA300_Chr09g0337681 [Helianthus annuus]|nr:hypothetical protein HanHA300_Chr09g0337681 [Helianthus annuus]KAJ0544194.1 hypothetical protein HanHA89_Chr09g0358861 [Helianthus annuus]
MEIYDPSKFIVSNRQKTKSAPVCFQFDWRWGVEVQWWCGGDEMVVVVWLSLNTPWRHNISEIDHKENNLIYTYVGTRSQRKCMIPI